jgi:tRNA threonylcarbamoyladenosine biosynthesis protein TsaB
MRTLVIDTATKACSVALFDDNRLIASHYELIGRGHAERLLPLMADLPENGRADRIMVNVGPGSFTGIRVGVAAARALAFAWGIEVAGYGCLHLVAAMAAEQLSGPHAIDVVMSGGHGEYFFQHFGQEGAPTASPVSLPPDDLKNALVADIIAGDIDSFASARHIGLITDARKWHLMADMPEFPPSPVYVRAPDSKLPKDAQ